MFDPDILTKLDPEHRGPVTEEMSRLINENTELRLENKEIAKETVRQMLGLQDSVFDYYGRYDFGPFYFAYALNELALGPWMTVDQGWLIIQCGFLFFTFGLEIPITKEAQKEYEDE